MASVKRALLWRAAHCALAAIGCLVCAVVFPFAILVRGITIAEKWAERREAAALRTRPAKENEGHG